MQHPTLVVNGVHDEMIPVSNTCWLSANLPNAVLLAYPAPASDMSYAPRLRSG